MRLTLEQADKKRLDKVLNKAFQASKAAVYKCLQGTPGRQYEKLRQHFDEIHRALLLTAKVRKLLDAFHRSRPKIDGPGGVARRLRLSRNAVYLWLAEVGLCADDFFEYQITAWQLCMRSRTIRPLLKRLELF